MDSEDSTQKHKKESYDMTDNSTKFASSNNTLIDQPGDGEKRNIRNSAFKIFGRYRRNKSVSSGTSHLSDTSNPIRKGPSLRSNSASSASTDRNGRASFRPFDRRNLRSFTSEIGPVTVLKPVSEFAEPCRAYNPLRDSTQSGNSLGAELQKKGHTHSYIETPLPRGFENKPTSPLKSSQETDLLETSTPFQKSEQCSSASNGKWSRQESPTTESLRSGCSSSRISNSTFSRAQHSEVSTSRGTSPELYPPRTSSKFYYPYTNERLASIEKSESPSHYVRATTPINRPKDSSSTSPLVFSTGTAKLARSYSGAGIEKACIVRCSSPNQNIGSKSPRYSTTRPTTPVSIQLRSEESQSSLEYKGTIHEASWIAPVRLGRTNTRSVRESNGPRCLSRSSCLRSSCNSPIPSSSICQSASSSLSSSSSSTSPVSVSLQPISLSKIMMVANVAPDFEQFKDPNLVTVNQRKNRKSSSVPAIAIATPLNHAGSDSDDLEMTSRYSFRKQRSTHSIQSIDPFLSHPRIIQTQEVTTTEKLSPREQDLKLRLNKMERDNAMLLSALDDIVKKFSSSGLCGTSSLRYNEEEVRRNEWRRVLVKKSISNVEENVEEYPPKRAEEGKRTLFNRVRF